MLFVTHAECRLCLNVTISLIMLSVAMLNVACAECFLC
jgi:hypothetical protein